MFTRALHCILFAFLAFGIGVGCTQSPASVCKKLAKIEKKDTEERRERCVKKLTKMKEKEPAKYKCLAGCVDKNEKGIIKCLIGCQKK